MKGSEHATYPEMDYYLNEDLSDVCFVIDGQRMPAYKPLLSMKSYVFRAQFSGNFADSGQKEIQISDATVDGFKAMLWFLYREELFLVDQDSVELCLDVYNLSHKYQLYRLMKCLENHIDIKVINKDNFADIHLFACERQFDALVQISMNFMSNKIDEWIDQDLNKVIQLNDKTNNSLLAIIFNKYRNNRSKYNQMKSYQFNSGQWSIMLNGQYYIWSPNTYLKDVIQFDK